MAKRKPTRTRREKLLDSDGALCVTFVNTQQRQPLESYQDLLAWGVETDALAEPDGRRLTDGAKDHPAQAGSTIRKAQTLRARLERILDALISGDEPVARDIRHFNDDLRSAMAARELGPTGRSWVWGKTDGDDFDRMLWPVLLSTAELLTTVDRRQLRRCTNEECELFFVARGSGKPRKWCSSACRNCHSTQKYYHKTVKPKREQRAKAQQGEQRARLAGYGADWQPAAEQE